MATIIINHTRDEARLQYLNAAEALQAHYVECLDRADAEFDGDEDAAWEAMPAEWLARYRELAAAVDEAREEFMLLRRGNA